jgi:hypothetical protein
LLRRDYEQGLVSGLDGGWVSILQTALIFDTRDFEPDPTRGYYVEIANEFSNQSLVHNSTSTNCLFKDEFIKKYQLDHEQFLVDDLVLEIFLEAKHHSLNFKTNGVQTEV